MVKITKHTQAQDVADTIQDYKTGLVANLCTLNNWLVGLTKLGLITPQDYRAALFSINTAYDTLTTFINEKEAHVSAPRVPTKRHTIKARPNKKVLARKHTRTNSSKSIGAVR